MAHQRKRSRPLDEAPGHEGPEPLAIAKFHSNVDGIRDYANVVPMSKPARYLRCGRTGSKAHGFVLLD